MTGSGIEAGSELMKEQHRIVTEGGIALKDQPFVWQADCMALAMLAGTGKGIAPYIGGGVQSMALDCKNG